jgi:ribosomal protein L13E
MEMSRRFFNMMSADLLSRSIKGVQIPDTVKQVMEDTTIDTKQLMSNGRGLSLAEMVHHKKEFD